MHIDGVPNRTSKPTYLLREPYRKGKKVRKRTVANLSALSDKQIEAIRAVLSGRNVRPIEELWQTTRSRSHGAVQVVRAAMQRPGFESLIASLCDGSGVRVLTPHTKLATACWWHTTTLTEEYGVVQTDETDLYAAIDWLYERQEFYGAKLSPSTGAAADIPLVAPGFPTGPSPVPAPVGNQRSVLLAQFWVPVVCAGSRRGPLVEFLVLPHQFRRQPARKISTLIPTLVDPVHEVLHAL